MKAFRRILLIGLFLLLYMFLPQCSTQNADGTAKDQQNGEISPVQSEEEMPAGTEVLVETILLTSRSMQSYILLSSTISTENMVDVYSKVSGDVQELFVEEGAHVLKGSSLLRIDDQDFKLTEQVAEVNFRKREAELKRVQESFEKNIISKVEFENAKFVMQEAELNWKQAQQNLNYANVTAPISGVITDRWVRTGDRVQISTKLFHIVDTSEKIAEVFIPEQEIGKVKIGQKAIIIAEFLESRDFQGTIKRISPVVDPNSGTFRVIVGMSDANNLLRPGMFVSIRIITAVHSEIIAVPKDAIVYDGGLPFIFVVKDNLAHKMLLHEGFSDEQYIESVSGLSENDEIIIVGQSGLKDKTKVKVMSTANKSNK